jgi:hypothetical protein
VRHGDDDAAGHGGPGSGDAGRPDGFDLRTRCLADGRQFGVAIGRSLHDAEAHDRDVEAVDAGRHDRSAPDRRAGHNLRRIEAEGDP